MEFKKIIKLNYKFSLGLITLTGLLFILIFQNCSKADLTGGKIKSNSSSMKAGDRDAENLISTMVNAGIKDDNVFNDTVDLVADSMTCGIKFQSAKAECVFLKGAARLITTESASVAVTKDYLENIGISRDCPTCADVESYTVRNIKCKQIPNFPHESICEFTK